MWRESTTGSELNGQCNSEIEVQIHCIKIKQNQFFPTKHGVKLGDFLTIRNEFLVNAFWN